MPGSHSKCSSLIYPNLINWCIYHGPIPILFKASSQWLFPEFWKGCYTISVSCLMLILTLVGLSPWRGCGHLLSLPILNTHYRTEYAAAAAKLLQLCPTLCDPIDGSPSGSPVPGILFRQEHLSELPFPSPMHESERGEWKSWLKAQHSEN